MSEIKDGGEAFGHGAENGHCPGMSLRDWFAGQALIGLVSSQLERKIISCENLSVVAFNIADALIAQRGKESK